MKFKDFIEKFNFQDKRIKALEEKLKVMTDELEKQEKEELGPQALKDEIEALKDKNALEKRIEELESIHPKHSDLWPWTSKDEIAIEKKILSCHPRMRRIPGEPEDVAHEKNKF